MSKERKNRSHDEVTANVLARRLRPWQLIELIDLPGFEKYQDEIHTKVDDINGLSLKRFEKVHKSSRGCVIEEIETGDIIHLHSDTEFGTWAKDVPAKKLSCTLHGATSIVFYTYDGRHEGPFGRLY